MSGDDGVGVGETVDVAFGLGGVAARLLRTANMPTPTNMADKESSIIRLGAPFSKMRLLRFSDRLKDFRLIQGANISLFGSFSGK